MEFLIDPETAAKDALLSLLLNIALWPTFVPDFLRGIGVNPFVADVTGIVLLLGWFSLPVHMVVRRLWPEPAGSQAKP